MRIVYLQINFENHEKRYHYHHYHSHFIINLHFQRTINDNLFNFSSILNWKIMSWFFYSNNFFHQSKVNYLVFFSKSWVNEDDAEHCEWQLYYDSLHNSNIENNYGNRRGKSMENIKIKSNMRKRSRKCLMQSNFNRTFLFRFQFPVDFWKINVFSNRAT
jgi:hypothetical protein